MVYYDIYENMYVLMGGFVCVREISDKNKSL